VKIRVFLHKYHHTSKPSDKPKPQRKRDRASGGQRGAGPFDVALAQHAQDCLIPISPSACKSDMRFGTMGRNFSKIREGSDGRRKRLQILANFIR
jgi:hypothetical protein